MIITPTQSISKTSTTTLGSGTLGGGEVIDEVCSFTEFVSVDEFSSVFFTCEVADSCFCSIFIL